MTTSIVHLVRHGEVENPDGVVYASIPGFGLSARGRSQAAAAATRLAGRAIGALYTSPLDRAVETAHAFVDRFSTRPRTDERLTEWALGERWSGAKWDDLDELFPGELETYFNRPESLDFAAEDLTELAARMAAAINDAATSGKEIVLVSHQDPIQAARLALTGRPLSDLQGDKPGHASIVSLRASNTSFVEIGYWEPEQGPRFPPAADR